MRTSSLVMAGMGVLLAAGVSGAQESGHESHVHDHGEAAEPAAPHHAEGASQERTLTGEVVDVFCYLSHPAQGLGKDHAGCAKKCIKDGLPVALKVGDQLYLATMTDHQPANATLAEFAGQQVTVTGTVMEGDGQHLISIASVKKAE